MNAQAARVIIRTVAANHGRWSKITAEELERRYVQRYGHIDARADADGAIAWLIVQAKAG
jgi:hypothetical protein